MLKCKLLKCHPPDNKPQKVLFEISFSLQDLRDLENDDLNVQLDIFEEHRDDDSVEFQHRWKDITVNFEYPWKCKKTLFLETLDYKQLLFSLSPLRVTHFSCA